MLKKLIELEYQTTLRTIEIHPASQALEKALMKTPRGINVTVSSKGAHNGVPSLVLEQVNQKLFSNKCVTS